MSIKVIGYSEKISDPNSSMEENYKGVRRCVRLNNIYESDITCLVRGSTSLNDLRDLVLDGGSYVFFPDPDDATGGFSYDMSYVDIRPGWTINPYGTEGTNIVTISLFETRN
jgi:hypothetical protein